MEKEPSSWLTKTFKRYIFYTSSNLYLIDFYITLSLSHKSIKVSDIYLDYL